MLSVNVVSSKQAEHYYTKDDYYFEEKSTWFGDLQKDLNYSKEMKVIDWKKAVYGYGPNFEKLNSAAGTEKGSHRAGTDLTFSAPKSVSLMATKDEDVIKAHDEAVNKTLQYIEENLAFTRTQKDGVNITEQVKSLLVGKHLHLTSRELEPQLHTHSVIINTVKDSEGKRKALVNDQILKNTKALGQFYRTELAYQLKVLGYDLEVTDRKEGFFKISSLNDEVVDRFSTRRKQVVEEILNLQKKYHNLDDKNLSQIATTNSRKKKERLSKDELINKTDEILSKEFNLELSKLIPDKKQILKKNHQEEINKDFHNSYVSIHDTRSIFSELDLINLVGKHGLGKYSTNEILSDINNRRENGEIISYESKKGVDVLSTKEMHDLEIDNIRLVKDELKSSNITIETETIEYNINEFEVNNFKLSDGQKNMAKVIANSEDRFIKIQGDAGTGKTASLKIAIDAFKDNDYNIELLAPTAKAATELNDATGIESSTVRRFLNNPDFKRNTLFIIDEAGMLGAKDAHALINLAKSTESKMVFMGDEKQFNSISAGRFFEELDKSNTSTVYLHESKRQKTEQLQTIVEHIIDKDMTLAFDALRATGKITEDKNLDTLYDKSVESYLSTIRNGNSSLLIASTNEDREKLNYLVRENLKENNKIINSKEFEVLRNANFNEINKKFASSYSNDTIIITNKPVILDGLKISPGTRFEFLEKDEASNSIIVQESNSTEQYSLKVDDYSDKFSVYKKENIELGIGDKIHFSKNDKLFNVEGIQKKVYNGLQAEIISIDSDIITVKSSNDETLKLNVDPKKKGSYQFIDHNYAVTEYKSQGSTVDHLISFSPTTKVNSFNSFYVATTRAKHDLTIMTDDIELLKKQVKTKQHKITNNDFYYKETKEKTKEPNPNALETKKILLGKDIDSTFDNMIENDLLSETKRTNDRVSKAVKIYIDNYKENNSALIINNNEDERNIINKRVREYLMVDRVLKNEKKFEILQNKDLSKSQLNNIENYDINDLIKFKDITDHRKYFGLIKPNNLYEIVSKDIPSNQLTIKDRNNDKTINIDFKSFKKIDLYEKKDLLIAEGDKLIFNEHSIVPSDVKIHKGMEATVKSVKGTKLELKTKNSLINIDLNNKNQQSYQYLSYAYCQNSDQKAKYDTIVSMNRGIEKKGFQVHYKALKNSKLDFKMITDNTVGLLDTFKINKSKILLKDFNSIEYMLDGDNGVDQDLNDLNNLEVNEAFQLYQYEEDLSIADLEYEIDYIEKELDNGRDSLSL